MSNAASRNKNIVIAVISFLLTTFICYRFYVNIKDSLVEQEKADLYAVAAQNIQLMEHQFIGDLNALTSLAATIKDEQQMQSKLQGFKAVLDVYKLKRIGVIDVDGNSYTTDGYKSNFAYRDFFKESMQGKRYISKHLQDSLGERSTINVLSVPIRKESTNEIIGVLFATYDSNNFRNIFDISSFEGSGYCVVFNDKGDIIVESARSPFIGLDNIKRGWSFYNEQGLEFSDRVLKDIQAGKDGFIRLNSRDQDKLVHYAPIRMYETDNKLFLFTAVPANALYIRLAPVVNNMRNMLLVVVIFAMCILAYLAYNVYVKGVLLSHIAFVDEVTAGANYAGFKKHLENRISYDKGYIIAIDVDRFTNIEKSMDRRMVENIIVNIWQVIEQQLGVRDFAARVGRDEFIVYTEENSLEQIKSKYQRASKTILELSVKMNMPVLHAVCGVYKLKKGDSIDLAYKHAHDVKFENKNNFDRTISVYDDASIALEKERQYMIDHFHIALEKEEFEVWYQPKIQPSNNELVGAEALVRWRCNGKLVPPGKFIPLFEANGLISPLDEYVFTKVCQQLSQWQSEGKKLVPISVNVSRASLYHTDIVEKYIQIMQSSGVPSEFLQIEITESATTNANLVTYLDKFHKANLKLLLDDFGSGYSSLDSLCKLPFDVIKIDKALIDIVEEKYGHILISQIIDLSKKMGREVTAEGTETEEQVKLLEAMHCDNIQGYYYSKPLPETEFLDKYMQTAI